MSANLSRAMSAVLVGGSLLCADVAVSSGGLLRVDKGDRVGYGDGCGTLIIPLEFEAGEAFSEGLAAVQKSGKWGFVARNGRFVVQPIFQNAAGFRSGQAPVQIGARWGAIDRGGRLRIQPD